jgi:pilus assembly protein CpaE
VLKPRPEPEDVEGGFHADDEFSPAQAESWRDDPDEPQDVDRMRQSPDGLSSFDLTRDEPEQADSFEVNEDDPEQASAFGLGHVEPGQTVSFGHRHEETGPSASFGLTAPEPAPADARLVIDEPPIPPIVNPYRVRPEDAGEAWLSESDAKGSGPAPAVHAEAAQPEPVAAPAPEPARPVNPVGDIIAGTEAALGDAAVPRISINIFCERADTAHAAEEAARDRRMTRASTHVSMGGLRAAVEQYQNQPTPSLVIVESEDHGAALIDLLDRLAEVCDPGTKVVVVGSHNDIALYRELMRRGVSEYLVPPVQTLQLIRAIATLYTDPSAPFIGRQIAFCGARGGVGSSTIAHNLAYTLSERMRTNAVIVDFDLAFGTAGLDFNQDPLQGVANALSQPDRLDPVLLDRMMARCTDRLSLFAAPATLDDDYEISAEAFEEVAGKIRTTAPYIVLDLPHLWSNWMRKVLLTADDVVITAQPDLACLRNAKNIVDLMRQTRPNDAPPWLVLNQVGVPGRPEIPIKDFSEAVGLDPVLVMPFDPKLFGHAANNGQMIEELGDSSKAAVGLQQLARVLARRDPPPAPKKSLLAGLFMRK